MLPFSSRAMASQALFIIARSRRSGAVAFSPSPDQPICAAKGESVMVEPVRMDITKLAPEAYRHLLQLEQIVAGKIDRKLYHLLKLRASQINGCAFCLGMHSDEALRDGETAERLFLLDAWEESSAFSEKERAALKWIEELTLIADTHASKEAFDGLKRFFSEEEIAYLTLTAALINSWNRIAIASRGQYDRAMLHHKVAEAKVAEPA
jgi:AhpD family alkylhydroperoxidase